MGPILCLLSLVDSNARSEKTGDGTNCHVPCSNMSKGAFNNYVDRILPIFSTAFYPIIWLISPKNFEKIDILKI